MSKLSRKGVILLANKILVTPIGETLQLYLSLLLIFYSEFRDKIIIFVNHQRTIQMKNYGGMVQLYFPHVQQYLQTLQLLNHFHLVCIATCFRYSPLRDCGDF